MALKCRIRVQVTLNGLVHSLESAIGLLFQPGDIVRRPVCPLQFKLKRSTDTFHDVVHEHATAKNERISKPFG